jgi:ketosteroid isomerase-like protein
MKVLIAVVLLILLGGQAQRLQDVPPQDRAAIQAVIRAQIEAFKKDDAARAFSFAAPGIRQVFQTPERFIEMVKTGYAQIYRPLKVEFGPASRSTGTLQQVRQIVNLVGLDGKKAVAYYLMERQPDGSWKIGGVQLELVEGDQTI